MAGHPLAYRQFAHRFKRFQRVLLVHALDTFGAGQELIHLRRFW
jgi:hypothetical protein